MSLHDAYTRTSAPRWTLFCEVNVELNRRQFIEVAAAAVPLMPLDSQGQQNDREDPDNPLGVRRDFPVVREGLY